MDGPMADRIDSYNTTTRQNFRLLFLLLEKLKIFYIRPTLTRELMNDLSKKEEQLRDLVRSYGSAVVAFSGGVDSSVVSKIASEELGDKAVAVTATSPTYPEWDLKDADKVVREIGIRHMKLNTDEFQNEDFVRNPKERCYHCKRELLGEVDEIREELGFQKIIEGTNLDDHQDYRPGLKAIEEFGETVVSPLYEVEMTKKETRKLAKKLNIPTAKKPSSPCLASRVPYGNRITEEKVSRIEKAEKYLRSLGFETVRVRDYKTLARLELAQEKIPEAAARREEIAKKLKEFGYKFVSLDLEGYRTGSLNPE